MQWLETKIPPLLVLLLLGIAAWGIARALPALAFELPLRTFVAIGLALAGLALNILPALEFQRAGTTVNPLRPAATERLVASGVYRHTRNPMYVGQGLILLGWVLHLHNAAALFAVPAFVLYISRYQIRPEERHLAACFPHEYTAFCKQAPRWL